MEPIADCRFVSAVSGYFWASAGYYRSSLPADPAPETGLDARFGYLDVEPAVYPAPEAAGPDATFGCLDVVPAAAATTPGYPAIAVAARTVDVLILSTSPNPALAHPLLGIPASWPSSPCMHNLKSVPGVVQR